MHKQMCIVYAPGDHAFAVAAVLAKNPRPTLLIAEELDALYDPSASILTFLDGMDTPRNPQGTYLIATTNYPRRIDRRIRQRPGRIDRRIRVGPINTQSAVVPIARQYLPEGVTITDKDLGAALARTTPAEMIEIINQAVRLTGADEMLDRSMIEKARAALKAELASADREDDEDEPARREDTFRRTGAAPDLADLDDLKDDIPF
jgi:SpoVK/Ycf46/Vps4 family AAA+-type ATPase